MSASLLIRDVLVADPESMIAPERKDVVITDGRIAAMAAGGTAKVTPPQIIDGRDRLLLPGLVNAHTHSPLNILKGTGYVLSHPAFMWRNQADTADRSPAEIRLSEERYRSLVFKMPNGSQALRSRDELTHSTLIFAALMIGHQRSASAF